MSGDQRDTTPTSERSSDYCPPRTTDELVAMRKEVCDDLVDALMQSYQAEAWALNAVTFIEKWRAAVDAAGRIGREEARRARA